MTAEPTGPLERATALLAEAQELHRSARPRLGDFAPQERRDEQDRDHAPVDRDHAMAAAQVESLLAIANAVQEVVDLVRPAVEAFTAAPRRYEFHRVDGEGRPIDEETVPVPVTHLPVRDDRRDRKPTAHRPTDPNTEGA